MQNDKMGLHGRYTAICYDRHGREKWRDTIENTLMTEGIDLLLDTVLAGSSYTVTGPFMGLISSVSYSAISAADVGTQIDGTNGWKEAGGSNAPTYTGNRPTTASNWNAASGGSKAINTAVNYVFTGSGTVKGCFLVYGSGATHTKDDAHGTLLSAGLFTGGDKTVASSDQLNVSYSLGN